LPLSIDWIKEPAICAADAVVLGACTEAAPVAEPPNIDLIIESAICAGVDVATGVFVVSAETAGAV
jgi:hypothetical protein